MFVKVSPGKYCTLVVEEGGLAAVDELLAAAEHPDPQLRTRPDVVHFAQQVRLVEYRTFAREFAFCSLI